LINPQVYRSDLDGLKAIGVLAVLWHHFSPNSLQGGYIGVDVFFVISGFLITKQILVQQLQGFWSWSIFYCRRINRIIPALWVVLMVCVIVGGWFLSPADWVLLSKSAIAALFGISNIFFWQEYGNYFGGSAKEALLLNTWSLGIEEQFYIVWPIILLLAIRISRKWLAVLGTFGFLIALLFSEWAVGRFASASYYLMPMRFFELMLGGMLAWVLLSYPKVKPSVWMANLMSIAAFMLLSFSLWSLSSASPFPGWRALLPALATILLIWAGSEKNWFTSFLGNRFLVHIGLISYSLYLWHWPIVAWLNYRQIEITGLVMCGGVLSSFLLAEITWRFIEQPARNSARNMSLQQTLVKRLVPATILLLATAGSVIYFSGLQWRFSPLLTQYEASLKQRPEQIRAGCHVPNALFYELPKPKECRLGAIELEPFVFLWGDSYANHFSGAINIIAKKQSVSVIDYTMDACPPILGYKPAGRDSYSMNCMIRNQQALKFLKNMRIKKVILAANWPADELSYQYLRSTLDELNEIGLSIIFIHNNQEIPLASKCVVGRVINNSNIDCGVMASKQPQKLLDLLNQYSNLKVLNPGDVMCQNGHCDPVRDGILLYRDSGHLNDYGARWLGQKWIDRGVRLFP
jgi:peptidoglycan/LPS O-acetylase OafA/YrhL